MSQLIRSSRAKRLFAIALCASFTGCYQGGSLPGVPFAVRGFAAPRAESVRSGTVDYRSLYSFGRKADDGDEPFANLTVVGDALYGTTEIGGETTQFCFLGCGTVFHVTTSGAQSVTYRFKGGADGADPTAGLLSFNGKLFGTTNGGGNEPRCSGGCGTVFELADGGKLEKILHRFAGGADGANPVAGLVAFDGTLYGTTQYGGKRARFCATGCGTIFSITPGGKEQVIYRFGGGADGAFPTARLTTLGGALYGTTEFGGITTALCAQGCGTVFRVTARGIKKTLYAFKDSVASPDGAYPAAGVVGLSGKLYGTTLGGGAHGDGAVYTVSESAHSERVIHSFSCCGTRADGQYPLSHLVVLRGTLYGTTHLGGTKNLGTIFSVKPSGDERVLYSFLGKPDGEEPQAGLALLNGIFYGTTSAGGFFSEGSIFKVSP